MKYTTSELAKILGVSGNTIRRFDEKGYLSSKRSEENEYRQFDASDVEKLMYVMRYRREEMSHSDVEALLEGNSDLILETLEKKREQVRAEAARLMAVDHLLKDDIMLMKRAEEIQGVIREIACQPVHYIRYNERGKLLADKEREQALRRFMDSCPEFYYMFFFSAEDILSGRVVWSEVVGTNTIMTKSYKVDTSYPVELYESRPCVARIIKLPIEWSNTEADNKELWDELFAGPLGYIEKKGMKLSGDVMMLKIGCFKENGTLMEYVNMHFPVE